MRHRLRVTIYTFGGHLREAVMYQQQIFSCNRPDLAQIWFNISCDMTKSIQSIGFEFAKTVDVSAQEMLQATRAATSQLRVDAYPPSLPPSVADLRAPDVSSLRHSFVSSIPPLNPPPLPPREPITSNVTVTSASKVKSSDAKRDKPSDVTPTAAAASSDHEDSVEAEVAHLNTVERIQEKPTASSHSSKTKLSQESITNTSQATLPAKMTPKAGKRSEKRTAAKVVVSKDGTFSCDKCTKTFKHKKSLRVHVMRAHSNERPHKCGACAKQFVRAHDLKLHMRTHSAQPQHACSQCDRKFYQRNSLLVHEKRRHSTKRAFVCPVCNFGFVRRCELDIHMTSHTKTNRRHKCRHCGKAFVRKTTLEQHESLHSGDKRHKCGVCGRRLLSAYFLAKHTKQHACAQPGMAACDRCGKVNTVCDIGV